MKIWKTIVSVLLICCLTSCKQFQFDRSLSNDFTKESSALDSPQSNLNEVTIPQTIGILERNLEQYSPVVEIISPQMGETLNSANVEIELKVRDLPLFQDDLLKLGNHLALVIDNDTLPSIYDLEKPILIENLTPGTHTLRAFAVMPWGESFKTKDAYAQTTFNVLTETNSNHPDSNLPVLTYNSPTGTYGAEPILLDFYLNYPESVSSTGNNDIKKPLVKTTVNGSSFVIEKWQPYYLTGFKPGENWVQLELIDEFGNNIENVFNNTVRVFNYNPQQQDTLSKLVTERISVDEAQVIVEQNYYVQPVETPEIIGSKNESESAIIIDASDLNTLDNELTINSERPEEKNIAATKSDRLEPETAAEKTTTEPPSIEEKGDNDNTFPVTVPNVISEKSELEPDFQDLPLTETSPSESLTPRDIAVKPLNKEPVVIATELESTPEKIVIKEPEAEQALVEIVISEPESLEINESSIAIAVPSSNISKPQPRPDLSAIETETKPKSLWWKKLLVGIRRQIESLARKLPSEV